jgi:hypothetical protein
VLRETGHFSQSGLFDPGCSLAKRRVVTGEAIERSEGVVGEVIQRHRRAEAPGGAEVRGGRLHRGLGLDPTPFVDGVATNAERVGMMPAGTENDGCDLDVLLASGRSGHGESEVDQMDGGQAVGWRECGLLMR